MFKKVWVGVVVGVMFLNIAFAADSTSTSQDLLSIIKQLQAQILLLQTQIADLQNQVQSVKIELNFTRALAKGASGGDVKQLQEFLKTFPNVYPEGLVTGYFGPLTEVAVKKFQEQNGIESVGIVGPKTQAKLTELATTGAGQSGVIPPGLLTAPGIQKKTETTTPSATSTPPSAVTTTTTITTTTSTNSLASTTASATTTSTGSTPAYSPPTPTPTPSPSPSTATTADTTSPSVPVNLTATPVSLSQINLSWTGSTDTVGVVGYKIYRGGAQIATVLASATSTSHSDTGLPVSTAYTYAVAAYDAAGNTSAQSASASATTQSPPAPTIPSITSITPITPYSPISPNEHLISSITLQWTRGPNETNDYLYRRIWRKFGNGDWLLVGQVQGDIFLDLNIGAGTYSYKMNICPGTYSALYGIVTDNCGADSGIVTTTLAMGGGSDTTSPEAPTVTKVWNPDWPGMYRRNFISWTASTDNVGVVGYNIYRNGTYVESAGSTLGEDDFLFSSLTAYSYTVAAYDAVGNVSPQSSAVSAVALSTGTPPPLNNTASSLANVLESLQSLTAILQKLQGLFR